MEIPYKLPMKATMFVDLAKGGYLRSYENREHGIHMTVSAETRNAKAGRTFAIDHLPDQVFASLAELREAVRDAE